MAIVTSDFLAGVITNFRALFAADFQAAQALQGWQRLAQQVRSTGEVNTYNWFGTVPKMQEVTHGQPPMQGLNSYNFSITNKAFQAVLEVERAALERDQLNLLRPRINQLAQEAARHPGELIFNDLVKDNANAFDGSAFFADTRTIGGSANIDNLLAGTGTTVALFQTDLGEAQEAMRLFQDDQGRPMNSIGNVIMVPANLVQTAWQALNANQGSILNPVLPATADGVLGQAGYQIVINPFLTDTNDWYLFHVGPGEDKPFIYQEEKAPELTGETNSNSAWVIQNQTFLYSVYARYNVGFTDPRFGVKIVNV